MGVKRNSFQGVWNIICFNWHFYLAGVSVTLLLCLSEEILPAPMQLLVVGAAAFSLLALLTSLLVSFYVYDFSDLYSLNWLSNCENKKVLNVNAGFDETSEIITNKFPNVKLTICDFYNSEKHTELSIKRARRAYPPSHSTIQVATEKMPFHENAFDYVIGILSVHEIRDENERANFFKELNRITKPGGQIFVTEHLRDLNNFLAYTIGFFHFQSRKQWLKAFESANLKVIGEVKTTPFITTFILCNHGDTH